MLKRTPFTVKHQQLGAKLVDFAGWEMPLYYGSQIEEHNCVRNAAGVFDVSHMNIVDVEGAGTRDYLRYLFANDVDKLKDYGAALYSCMLNERGGVVDDLIVYKISPQYFRVVVNAATHDKDITWLKQHAANFAVELRERTDFAMLAVQGPLAREKMQQVFTQEQKQATANLRVFYGVEVDGWWIARTGYTGEDGYEIMLPKEAAADFWDKIVAAKIHPCGLVSRDSLRLEAGMSLYGSELNEDITPLESNIAWTVALGDPKRNFIGRPALEKQKRDGIKRNIVGLILEGKGVLRTHEKVIVPGIGEGETTSGGFSPTLGVGIALARIPVGAQDKCFVVVRDKQLSARIIKPPFVKRK
jgi:aminomethyltransferase